MGVLATALCLVALRLWPTQPLQQTAAQSRAFYSSEGALLRVTLASDEQYRVWTPLNEIEPRLVEAVQLYEDRWYRWHPGVNPVSLVRGAWTSYSGGARRGASTLTMQLARRLYRIDSGTPRGKLKQVAAALWLEARYSKRDILEAYLNLAPYGGNIEGVGAASLVYFGKRAVHLSLPESLALAVIPQNPNRRGAGEAAWPVALQGARERLWQVWQQQHTASAARDAEMDLPLKLRSVKQLPFGAPHAVQTLLAQLPAQPQTTLSLHAPTQAALERAIRQFIERRQAVGVRNAAALLVDSSTMQVKAWVGSADYFNDDIDGQVNATTAKRSPGSTLKPFIYGLGLDQGVLHPHTILKDAPTAFGTYSPENFDGRFEGPITAQEALIKSRNIPAVSVSARLSQPSLYGFLKQAGVTKLAGEQHYGLALTLGGGELSMEELATLYAMLANGGELLPLVYTARDTQINIRTGQPTVRPEVSKGSAWPFDTSGRTASAPQRLLSEEATFITLDMLSRNPRPDTGMPAFPAVAWKTGTSWGFRDAWTAGVFGRYVLVVWVGNFDGSSNAAFVGVQTAAPLFFSIVDSLRSQGLDPGAMARPTPANLARVSVCAASGDLPNAHCKDLASTWFIPGKSPIKVSSLHREVFIDQATGHAVCAPGPGVRSEVFEFWGTDMLQIFAQAGLPRRIPPVARCGAARTDALVAGDGPQIVAPLRGANYVLRIGQPTPLSLRANAAQSGPLYWFADAAFVGEAQAGKDLSWSPPAAGRYVLSVVDAQGVTDTRDVAVEFAP
ncbi:MAG: penicillin-binding protein 1C [Rhizobacter sp.]